MITCIKKDNGQLFKGWVEVGADIEDLETNFSMLHSRPGVRRWVIVLGMKKRGDGYVSVHRGNH